MIDVEARPTCACHGEPMHRNGSTGAVWRCAVKNRTNARTWGQANRPRQAEHGRRWRKAHPDRSRDGLRRRRATRHGVTGGLIPDQWEAVCAEFGDRCVYCGAVADSQDHDVPPRRGGPHTRGNVVPACGLCNSTKGERTGAEWALEALARQFRAAAQRGART